MPAEDPKPPAPGERICAEIAGTRLTLLDQEGGAVTLEANNDASVLVLSGAPIDEPPTVHVVVPSRRQLPRRAGVTVHERLLAEEDVVVTGGLPLTSGPQTFLDLAARLPPAELVAVGDALMRGGHLPPEALARRLERAARTYRGLPPAQ